MKPMGPIPPGFDADADGMMRIGGLRADRLADAAGDTPLFVIDLNLVAGRVARFRAAMPRSVALWYAMKANPHPTLLAAIAPLVDGCDVASGGELEAALAAGFAPATIGFAGPGKRDRELAAALRVGATIHLESAHEAERALALAAQLGVVARAAVRVNPPFALAGSGLRMGGGASPFGVPADAVADLVRRIIDAGAAADWRGIHIYLGTQALRAESVATMQAAIIDWSAALARSVGRAPPVVNLGGGFGVPYHDGDEPLDIAAVGGALDGAITAARGDLGDTRFVVELGRWLVSEAGVYLTRVIDIKDSGGTRFVVVDGGLHHMLAAAGQFGSVVRRNYPVAVASRFGTAPRGMGDVAPVSIVGCLCTPLDRLADAVVLPPVARGDLVAVFHAGAYGASASPAGFLGHGPAPEMMVRDGRVVHAR